jgi:hypothetical protein
MRRECGDCQLCCKLVAVQSLGKPAGQRCKFQKFGKGCAVYHTRKMPPECGLWNCRWLVNDDADELSRPDRSHYVIDLMPDYVTLRSGGGEPIIIQVVQIWCDPKHPQAHRDPALRRWMVRRARDGIGCLVRFNSREALAVFAPPLDKDGQWHEVTSGTVEQGHSFADIEAALGGQTVIRLGE